MRGEPTWCRGIDGQMSSASSTTCSTCGAALGEAARFCASCGSPVEATRTAPPPPPSAAWPEGERRGLTVAFCDLVGSTSLGQRLDVEEYTELIEDYVSRAAASIERFGGYVAQVQGDGIVAYFGYPVTNEDDAERAVRAGLAIQESLADLADGSVAARGGLPPGPVVGDEVGGARRARGARGVPTNTAARIESATPAGRVGVSEATRRLLRGRFALSDAGEHELKGIDQRLAIHLVDGDAAELAEAPRPERTLLGRDHDLSRLRHTVAHLAAHHEGATVVVVGEPGIGKSHLATSALEDAAPSGARTITVACSSMGSARAFGPVIELLQRLLDLPDDAEVAALHDALVHLDLDLDEHLPHLADLLGMAPAPDRPLPVLGPELRRRRAVTAAVRTVAAAARAQPSVVLCEDIQWADPSTLAMLETVATATTSVPLVLFLTARPGAAIPMGVEVLRLERVPDEVAASIVRAAGGEALAPDTVATIVERADGVPFFVEEITAAAVESGDVSSIPSTIQGSLGARLDRLGSARSLAQLAALLGRDVVRDELRAIAELEDQTFEAHLGELVEGGVLVTDGSPTFRFKHALIQDSAEGSLVRRTKRRLHGRIADTLTTSFPDVVEAEPERLAHHCAAADRHLDAIGHYRRAAGRAASSFANQEAAELLRSALQCYERLDEAEQTPMLEIELRAEYGGPLSGVHGLLGDPVAANYERLEQLERDADDVGERLAALLALTGRYPQVAAMPALMDAGAKLLDVADELEVPMFSAVGHMMSGLGATTIVPDQALLHLDRVEEMAAQGHVPPPFLDHAPDLLVLAKATKGIILVPLGRIRDAQKALREATHLAEEVHQHPFSTGTALTLTATSHVWLGEPEQALGSTERAIEQARRHGFSNFEAMNLVQHGWALTVTGGDGSEYVREGLELLTTSTMSSYPHQLRVAAMEALHRGATAEARDYVAKGVRVASETGETGYLPTLHQVDGWIERAEGHPDRAEAHLRRAHQTSAEFGSWLVTFEVVHDLVQLGAICGPEAVELLRSARRHVLGGDDTPVVRAGDALLAQLEG